MNATAVIKSYAKVGIESGVNAADPHKLISMLYQGALLAIANAKRGIMGKDIPAKGAAISKAIAIIDEGLNASLDKNVGGDLAQNLSSLYDYMSSRLLSANLNSDIAALDEVARLLTDLQGAWDSIRKTNAPLASASARDTIRASQGVTYLDVAGNPPSSSECAGLTLPADTQPLAVLAAEPITNPQQNAAHKKVQLAYGRG